MNSALKSRRIWGAGSLLAGAASVALALQSFAPVDGNISITTTPGPISPNSPGSVYVTGNPGDWVLVMVDTAVGGSVLPYLGGIPIDLGKTGNFISIFQINQTGSFSLTCHVPCENEALFGVPFYIQAVSLNPATKELCVSNVSELLWDDDGSCTPSGCTPGYWRQEHHYDDWAAPYTPDTLFSAVFDDAFPGKTLGEVVDNPGGALNQLGFHAVAGLLNAASSVITYEYTVPEVIQMFNDAYPGTDAEYEAVKDLFDAANNAGCPL